MAAITLVIALALTISSSAASLIGTGISFQFNNLYYYASPFTEHTVRMDSFNIATANLSHFGFIPVTVVLDDPRTFVALFSNWSTQDDVWQPGFLETILTLPSNQLPTAENASFYSGYSSNVYPLLAKNSRIPPGPYFLNIHTGSLHQTFRLYEDFAGTFTQSLLQKPDGRFQTLSAQIPSSASITIGVPSRLYFKKTQQKPLAGVRVGVKDIYSLAGVKKSCGNRAYYGLYPASNVTCTAIQNLIDAGAIIVGLQKTSQFANGETPTADWVDYHAPFNPRGDGYQDTSSSSAGAGASIASYEWLDLAVGSDTGGSIRGPANNQGVFGNRPSHGLVSLDNVMPLSPSLDTPGFLARDPAIWDAASAAMYKSNYTSFGNTSPRYPQKLFLLDFPTKNTSQARMIRKFASDLAGFLSTTTTNLDLDQQWNISGPVQVRDQSISQLLNLTYTALITKQQIRLLRDPFYRDYAAAHDGRLPFIDPVPFARWAWGAQQPASVEADAITNKTLFMNWFNEKILPPVSDARTCSSAILLHTDSTGHFSDRNTYLSPPAPPFGFSDGEISVFAETPDSVFPLGQAAVFSSITNHTEYLPVTVDVMAAKGCDGVIAKLARDLVAAGILDVPKTGSGLDGGEILLRR